MKKFKLFEDKEILINSNKATYKSKKIENTKRKLFFRILLFLFGFEVLLLIIYFFLYLKNESKNTQTNLQQNNIINYINNNISQSNNKSESNNNIYLNINNNISQTNNNLKINNANKNLNISKKLTDIIYTENQINYDSLFNAANRARNFINKSAKGILFNKTFKVSDSPKISVVIPVYNCEKTIKRAIRSIQNQNYTNFEIILVNDFSTDKSSNIIDELKKKDPRIKILNNKKNMGTLYTRCIGSLSAKGKYIYPLDNDDMLLDRDILYNITFEIAEKNDFDIVEFRAIETHGLHNFYKNKISEAILNKHKKGRVLYQPELSLYSLRPSIKISHYHQSDVYIWAKCIKAEIYKKAVTLYGEERYSNYVTTFEDLIINYIIFQFAKSFVYVPKYGILRIFSGSSAYLHTTIIPFNKYEMRLLDAVVDFSRNTTEGKKVVVNIAVKVLENKALDMTLKKKKYKILLKSILKRIFKCEYISKEDKEIIKEKSSKFNSL